VAISKYDPEVITATRCTCQAKMDGKCTHVAALLFLIEDLTLNAPPRIAKACTSRLQTWGHGAKPVKDPVPLQLTDFEKARKSDLKIQIDPRPLNLRRTTQEEINAFVIANQCIPKPSNWLACFRIKYNDYVISHDRKAILIELCKMFMDNLSVDIQKYYNDELSTPSGVHVTGSAQQSECDLWMRERGFRVTASTVLDFTKNPFQMIDKTLWNNRPDLSNVPAINWGREHEQDAILAYEEKFGETTKCGLFVSKDYPYLGASPDAIHGDFIIEIKCPFSLKKNHPEDIESLKPAQKYCYFNEKVNGVLKLKKRHKYFCQVQTQLFVTGFKKARFVT
jgi:hypothetical protein